MENKFCYNGEWFRPYRKMTKAEREQPLSSVEDKLSPYLNKDFVEAWDFDEFYSKANSDADLFWWKGRLVLPAYNTFFILTSWL